MPGDQAHPQPRVRMKKAHELVTTGWPNNPAFPARWFYGFLRALPGDRAFLPPSQATMRKHCRSLDLSVERSGPHDFAVRSSALRRAHRYVHRIPRPTFRDDREASLGIGRETGELVAMICPSAQGGFLGAG
jgi:hypothetical protein